MPQKECHLSGLEKQCQVYRPINLETILVVPFEIDSKEICSLLSYFLYRAPNISSTHASFLNLSTHKRVFDVMFAKRGFQYRQFCSSNAIIEAELSKANLQGDNLCLKCKRFVCKKKPRKKDELAESDLSCFLRHLRNSIAHGRLHYQHAGNKVFFVFEDKNSTGKIASRIVCLKSDLQHWKKTLEANVK